MSDTSDRTSENTVYADAIGATVAPARYNRGGRETIDTQRDIAGLYFESAIQQGASTRDAAFYTHCMLTALAYRVADAARLGPFSFVALPASVLLDWLVWDMPPDLATLLGGAVVVASCVMSERSRLRGAAA